MKTENIIKAADSFAFFADELQLAHKDAINSGNQFAEIALLALIEQAAGLGTKLNRIKDAAIQTTDK